MATQHIEIEKSLVVLCRQQPGVALAYRSYTRALSPRLSDCQLTHIARSTFDLSAAIAQHTHYESVLGQCGYSVQRLPELTESPDGVFVEDTALIIGSHAILTRPGRPERTHEVAATAAGLAGRFTILSMMVGRLDGGDVLQIGSTLYVGLTTRTDRSGVDELRRLAAPLGYEIIAVPVTNCLHLKTAATFAGLDSGGNETVVINPNWVDPVSFASFPCVAVPQSEPFAANTLRLGDRLLVTGGTPRTQETLATRGFNLVVVDIAELQKAEAGLTCLSLISDN